jgi:phage terminase small subunit
MGRPRKSPDERRLEGNRSRTPIPIDVVVPEGAPFVPEHLSDDAQACMELILRSFPTKRMTAPDSLALAAFATAWAWHKAATHAMNSPDFEPIVGGSTGSPVPNPWFKVLNEQARIMLAYAPKLYLTPADRSGIAVAGQERAPSKFEGLRGGLSAPKTSSITLRS